MAALTMSCHVMSCHVMACQSVSVCLCCFKINTSNQMPCHPSFMPRAEAPRSYNMQGASAVAAACTTVCVRKSLMERVASGSVTSPTYWLYRRSSLLAARSRRAGRRDSSSLERSNPVTGTTLPV